MIFIPKKINICFQNNHNSLCDKLGFITYFDEQNKMRKSDSWNHWGDKKIPTLKTMNEPISGFILDNAVGGIHSWSERIAYCRVYDPRGFEIEVTIPNLLWILSSTVCNKKELQGEFVYAWGNSGELLLVSTRCSEYESLIKERDKLFARKPFSPKELIVGHIYKTRGGTQLLYMGRYPKWEILPNYTIDNRYYGNKTIVNTSKTEYPIKDILNYEDNSTPENEYRYKQISTKQKYFFFYEIKDYAKKKIGRDRYLDIYSNGISSYTNSYLKILKSISGRFIEDLGECELFKKYINELKHEKEYCPIDFDKSKIQKVSFDKFKSIVNDRDRSYCYHVMTINEYKNLIHGQFYEKPYRIDSTDKPYLLDKHYYTIEELYEILKPYYGTYYLKNGNVFGYIGLGIS